MKLARDKQLIDLAFVENLLRRAGKIAIGRQLQSVYQLKGDDSIVTPVDRKIEEFLINRISRRYPNSKIISEESPAIQGKSIYTWIIDPLDGTRVFYGGLPIWGISIGIIADGQPQFGAFYLPKLGEMYIGTPKKSFLNGQELSPVVPPNLEAPTTFLAVPSQCHRLFNVDIKRLHSFGSLAAHLAYVARGAALGALTQHTSAWDIAAMLPILESVGVTAKYLSGQELVLSDLLVHGTTEPLVFAHSSIIDSVRERITLKTHKQANIY